jgi:hypothetical protein
MHRTALTAMSIMRIFNTFEPNVGVKIRLASRRLECQVVITATLDVVQNEASFFFARMDATSGLRVPGV